jgi:mRNA-degrading endonuclease HigB of HigAB toxin-antitoxin module
MSEEGPKHLRQPPEDSPHFTAIGRIASAWATLDFEIDSLVWDLADIEPTKGACITAQLVSTRSRLQALLALMTLREADDKLMKAVRKFVTDTQELVSKRNRMVHDHWMYEVSTKKMHRLQITADPKPIFDLKDTSLEAIAEVAKSIEAHVIRFMFTRAEIMKRLLPSLYKQTMQGYGLDLDRPNRSKKATDPE